MAASATFALKAGVWFRRGRLLIVSPDSWGTACPLSGGNSTYRPVQISGTSSVLEEEIARALLHCSPDDPMVADIKRRILHLKEELERFCNKAIADRRLH
jgi:hypothetical protein